MKTSFGEENITNISIGAYMLFYERKNKFD